MTHVLDAQGRIKRAPANLDTQYLRLDATNSPVTGALTITDNLTVTGVGHFGDGANYAQFAADGELTLAGTARVEKYAVISAASFQKGSTAPTSATEGTFQVLQFSNTRTESAYVNWHVPGDWAVGTDIRIAFYWAPTSGAAGHVAWEFDWEAVASEANETLGAGSTNVEIHDDTQSLDNELLETSYGTIAGGSISVDDTIGICITRDHDDTDTYGAPAALVHMEIEYIADKLGVAT